MSREPMRYCKSCVLPDTRPNLALNVAGICNACESRAAREELDWSARDAAFRELVAATRARAPGFDCGIPVSVGKDSTWQVVKCLEHGLRPRAVTWKTPARTA